MKASVSTVGSHPKDAQPEVGIPSTATCFSLKERLISREVTGVVVAFLAFFTLVWLLIQPALQYYSWSPVFLFNSRFLREHLAYPGGLADYAGAFLLQFYRYSWLGALLTTILALGLFVSARALFKAAGVERHGSCPSGGPCCC